MSGLKSYQLAVNTSQSQGQLVLFDQMHILDELYWEKAKSHSEVVTLSFSEIVTKAGIPISSIDTIYCVVGPGSFTGLRVGINFCKSLAYSLDCSVVPINTLRLLAMNGIDQDQKVMAAVDAQKNSVFVSTFDVQNKTLTSVIENQVVSMDDLESLIDQNYLVCGDGLNNYKRFLPEKTQSLLDFTKANLPADLKNILNDSSLVPKPLKRPWFEIQPLYIKASAPEEKISPTVFHKP